MSDVVVALIVSLRLIHGARLLLPVFCSALEETHHRVLDRIVVFVRDHALEGGVWLQAKDKVFTVETRADGDGSRVNIVVIEILQRDSLGRSPSVNTFPG